MDDFKLRSEDTCGSQEGNKDHTHRPKEAHWHCAISVMNWDFFKTPRRGPGPGAASRRVRPAPRLASRQLNVAFHIEFTTANELLIGYESQ
jgi:hypothetical protein